jgi:monoamine oxidase
MSMRVAIVGAGFSGLQAAHSLTKLGHDVEVFEAKDDVGGRCRTITCGNAKFEAGGEWIDADHSRLLGLAQGYGLELLPTAASNRGVFYRGRWQDGSFWEAAEKAEEKFYATADALVSRLPSPAWASELLKDLDNEPLSRLIEDSVSEPEGRWWLTSDLRSDEGEDLSNVGVLGWLIGYQNYLERSGTEMSAYRLKDGMSGLARRMASELNIHLGRSVREIESSSTAAFVDGTEFDAVIVTVPPAALPNVTLRRNGEPIPDRQNCNMARAIKLTWQFRSPIWEGTPGNGNAYLEGPLQQVWTASLDNNAYLLSAYVCGQAAMELAACPDPLLVGLEHLSKPYPTAPIEFERGWISNWVTDAYAQGAFTVLSPGCVFGGMERWARPCDRVHFAGEYTSRWLGFVEGALESGERAAKEVHEAWN